MQTTASLFMVSPLQSGLYQQLLTSVISFQDLGNRLIRHAHQAKACRRMVEVREAAEILCNLPIKDFQVIGQYYLAWCERRTNPHAIEIFEKVAETAPTRYRALAMHSLAANAARKQDYESELYWFVESLKVRPSVEAFIGIAVLKAKEGYHRAATKALESILPIVRYSEPLAYFDFLNSYAVELAEVGRKHEARNVIRHVLESPLIIAYPEWQETAEELKGPNRSFVVIDPSPARMGKLLSMPMVEHAEPVQQNRPAPVVNLEMWKAKMGKDKNGENPEILKDMNVADMMIMLMNLVSKEGNATEEKMRKLLEYANKLFSK